MAVVRMDESKWPTMSWDEKREAISDAIDEIRNEFIFYARKHDERLPVGAIEEALKEGVISAKEIGEWFADGLR